MRSILSMLAWSMAVVLFGANVASAHKPNGRPHEINYNWHEPAELKAANPPGPTVAVDDIGGSRTDPRALTPPTAGRVDVMNAEAYRVEPGGPAAPSDADAVRWPTVDRSVWLKTQSTYTIQPR